MFLRFGVKSEGSKDPSPASAAKSPGEVELAERYYPLVHGVVNRMRSNLPPNADIEELHSIGVSGLMSAIQRYDHNKEVTFPGYAALRIRGAILDELRKMDTISRQSRAKMREINEVVTRLEQAHGRVPSDVEVAAEMKMTTADLASLRQKVTPKKVVSLDETRGDADDSDANLHEAIADERIVPCVEQLENTEAAQMLAKVVKELPERQRKVVSMYYFDNKRLADIAEVFGVTEARICQIHSQALGMLRKHLSEQMG